MASKIAQAAEKSETRKSKLRPHEYVLYTLLIFIFVFAGVWCIVKLLRAKKRTEAVGALIELGCRITYDYEWDSAGKFINNAQPPAPEWLRNLLGVDFFSNVTEIWMDKDTKIPDAELVNLEGLTQLADLELPDVDITDAGLEHIKGLTNLKTLVLRENKITDAGLMCLKNLTNLNYLVLSGPEITDAGLGAPQKSCTTRNPGILGLPYYRCRDGSSQRIDETQDAAPISGPNNRCRDGIHKRLPVTGIARS